MEQIKQTPALLSTLWSSLEPLGDQGLLIYLPDESPAPLIAQTLKALQWPWLLDIVPAYGSVGLFFNADQIGMKEVVAILSNLPLPDGRQSAAAHFHIIPCCYEMQLDWKRIAEHAGHSIDYLIQCHCSVEYQVYAIGFVPGFPYLGYLPQPLCGVPRLGSPRLRVEPGSVGLTGRQTGIYPLPRPGGWNLIGKTPLSLVDVEDGYFPLRVGDRIQFHRIDEREYQALKGERLISLAREVEPLRHRDAEKM